MDRFYIRTKCCKKIETENRIIYTNNHESNLIYGRNKVINSKYTALTFFPYNFLSQLFHFINFYFILVACLHLWKTVSEFNYLTIWIPTIVAFLLQFIREGIDDYHRHKRDAKVNTKVVTIIRDNCLIDIKREDILCGDILVLDKGSVVPADMVIVMTSNQDGSCYLDTSNVNGETFIKKKFAIPETQEIGLNGLLRETMVLRCSPPNSNMSSFDSTISLDCKTYSLSITNFVHSGSLIVNTERVYGIACYTGRNTKTEYDSIQAPIKWTQFEKFVDKCAFGIFIIQVILTIIWGSVGNYKLKRLKREMPYLKDYIDVDENKSYIYFRAFLLMSMIIPISLKYLQNISKLVYSAWIVNDAKMYDKENKTIPMVNTSNVIENLGGIQYMFVDKTGTITENQLELQKIKIGNILYGSSSKAEDIYNDNRLIKILRLRSDSGRNSRQNIAATNSAFTSSQKERKRQAVLRFIYCLAVCHSCRHIYIGRKDMYEGIYPEEVCFLNALKKLKIRVAINFNDITISSEMLGILETTFRIHAVLPFTSVIKHMSVIAENMQTHEIFLFTKGAPEVIEAISSHSDNQTVEIRKRMRRPKSMNDVGMIDNPSDDEIRFRTNDRGNQPPPENQEEDKNDEEEEEEEEEDNDDDEVNQTPNGQEARLERLVQIDTTSRNSVHFPHFIGHHSQQLSSQFSSRQIPIPINNMSTNNNENANDQNENVNNQNSTELYESEENQIFLNNARKLSSYGLRVMGMAYKPLNDDEFELFMNGYNAALAEHGNNEELVQREFAKIQNNLLILGLTGIEDRLQMDVVETISTLRFAGIKIWMMTGDMRGTALKIAYASGLIPEGSEFYDITSSQINETPRVILENLDAHIQAVSMQETPIFLLIDGSSGITMEYISNENVKLFSKVAANVSGIICYRASPWLKCHLVKIIEKLGKVTMAVGDGFNDLSMIRESHVGIGIMREGHNLSCCGAADIAINNFKDLQRLILVHGRFDTYRSSWMAQFSFYKGILIAVVQVAFNFFNGFSATTYITIFNLTCYDLLFSILPVIFFIFDKDVEEDTVFLHPCLYSDSRNRTFYNERTMAWWIIKAIYQGIIIVVIMHFSLNENQITLSDGSPISLIEMQQTAFSSLISNLLLTITLDTLMFTSLHFIFIWGCWFIYIFITVLANITPSRSVVSEMYLTVWRTIANPNLWITTVTAASFSILPIVFFNSLFASFLPTRAQALRFKEIRKQSKFQPAYSVLENGIIDDYLLSETVWDKTHSLWAPLASLFEKKKERQ